MKFLLSLAAAAAGPFAGHGVVFRGDAVSSWADDKDWNVQWKVEQLLKQSEEGINK